MRLHTIKRPRLKIVYNDKKIITNKTVLSSSFTCQGRPVVAVDRQTDLGRFARAVIENPIEGIRVSQVHSPSAHARINVSFLPSFRSHTPGTGRAIIVTRHTGNGSRDERRSQCPRDSMYLRRLFCYYGSASTTTRDVLRANAVIFLRAILRKTTFYV